MFDPDYDPYDEIELLRSRLDIMERNIEQIAVAFNTQADLARRFSTELTRTQADVRALEARLRIQESYK